MLFLLGSIGVSGFARFLLFFAIEILKQSNMGMAKLVCVIMIVECVFCNQDRQSCHPKLEVALRSECQHVDMNDAGLLFLVSVDCRFLVSVDCRLQVSICALFLPLVFHPL